MIKEQIRQSTSTKDELVDEMVSKTYKRLREMGQFQTIHQIFGKLPVSRIEKQQYQFLFDSVKQNVNEIINRQDTLLKILERENEAVMKIEVKTFKDVRGKLLEENKKQESGSNVITLRDYDFEYLNKSVENQKLSTNKSIFRCVMFIRRQDQRKGKQFVGESMPFLPDEEFIDLKSIKETITDIRHLLDDQPPLRKFNLQFSDQNHVQFESRRFPSNYQIEKRAETLAKIYLLHLYREQGRKAKQIYKNNEMEQNKQRQIRKIKQQMDIEKIKEGEMIQEMDLIKQAHKILILIEKKMNELAFAEFQQKHGDKATQIKRSLQKIKNIVNQETSARNKLKILITYKHKKGW